MWSIISRGHKMHWLAANRVQDRKRDWPVLRPEGNAVHPISLTCSKFQLSLWKRINKVVTAKWCSWPISLHPASTLTSGDPVFFFYLKMLFLRKKCIEPKKGSGLGWVGGGGWGKGERPPYWNCSPNINKALLFIIQGKGKSCQIQRKTNKNNCLDDLLAIRGSLKK